MNNKIKHYIEMFISSDDKVAKLGNKMLLKHQIQLYIFKNIRDISILSAPEDLKEIIIDHIYSLKYQYIEHYKFKL